MNFAKIIAIGALIFLSFLWQALPNSSQISAQQLNGAIPKGPVIDAINTKAELYSDKDARQRAEAYMFFHGLHKHVRDMHLRMIDFRVDNYDRDQQLDHRGELNPPKALAILMQMPSSYSSIEYLLKHLEYQADKISTYVNGNAFTPDHQYPTYLCVAVLKQYGSTITPSVVRFLTGTPEDRVTDKKIELIGYLLHRCYGSGQGAVRIVTVLAEEDTKQPHAKNVVRLIDHLGSTYKP